MPNPRSPKAGRPHLRRDDQQWFFDWMIKETGKVFHFQSDGRGRLPRSVRSHDMIAKHMGLSARRLERPEIDPGKIGVYALSFGSFWGMQIAASERRICAVAAPWASFVDKYYLMTEESPRYKQLFAYLTQSSTEEELDKVVREMSMEGRMDQITCSTLLVSGEYDPRAPIEEVYRLFDQMKAPAELWVLADQHHNGSVTMRARTSVWEADIHAFVCDSLRERFNGVPVKHPGQVLYVEPAGAGPNSPSVTSKRRWFD
ncbi:MAG: hypothetical protein A3G24_00675 [Betaproteobacteria bacterium RIFCSPLOWO2_12_FULL_62_13]|nr:MAG: hypothetical protein A3G24_00675 [Betaproteobacteria bacterium RIFCSPLOWO2_12_FULL_62_13]